MDFLNQSWANIVDADVETRHLEDLAQHHEADEEEKQQFLLLISNYLHLEIREKKATKKKHNLKAVQYQTRAIRFYTKNLSNEVFALECHGYC